MESVKKTRTRLSPEARISEILDHTAVIVSSEGVAAVSMEKIGKAAGISKSLVYSYFPSITDLLKKLLHRELKELRAKQTEAAENADTFEQLVRAVTRVYLLHIEERGLIIYRLLSEPSVAEGAGPTHYGREAAVHYLADIVHKVFDLPMHVAIAATDISFGLPDAAGHFLDRKKADRQMIEDLTVSMIIGSVKMVKENYDVMFKPIR
jgi:AcrR family transcriptional regulator